ncbi:MAG TPA: SURF1 family protein [Gemmatimonadaceae bacterium]|nr:SURF1 family protein [Gemmatimonadaceae bacterium]
MKRGNLTFVILGSIFALICLRLGFWQLARLSERKALNRELSARATTAPVPLNELPQDTGAAHFRRVTLSGTYDFAHEIYVTNRTRNGSPGVQVITPLKRPGTDTAVLVTRGWVYAPDGMTIERSRWKEPDTLKGEAFVVYYLHQNGAARLAGRDRSYRWLDDRTLSQDFPYPIAAYHLILISGGAHPGPNVPPRLDVPPLDEGPHQSYAIQWFSFATISIIGMFLFVRRK